jgi:hypothetical protein
MNSQILPEHSLPSENAVRLCGTCLSVISFTYMRKVRPSAPALCTGLLYPIAPNQTTNVLVNTWAKILLASLSYYGFE